MCRACLTSNPDHFLICKKGGCVNRIHKASAQLLACFCREAGEVVVPEFVRTKRTPRTEGVCSLEQSQLEQGILDVVASHPVDSTEFLLDATIRHPMSVRYKLAPSVPGLAAISGENDKQLRYPASGGRSVTPCSLETWGRLGPSLTRFLDSLSASAQRRDVAHSLPRGLYLQRWLTMLSCNLGLFLTVCTALPLLPSTALTHLPFCPPHTLTPPWLRRMGLTVCGSSLSLGAFRGPP